MMNWIRRLFGVGNSEPPSGPVATLKKEARNLYVLRIGGVLNKATVDNIQSIGARDIEAGVKDLRILLVLNDFRGWRRGDDWGDIDFFAQYEHSITRIAVVGDPRWETETLMFLAAGHRQGEVRYFGQEEEAKARAWLVS